MNTIEQATYWYANYARFYIAQSGSEDAKSAYANYRYVHILIFVQFLICTPCISKYIIVYWSCQANAAEV